MPAVIFSAVFALFMFLPIITFLCGAFTGWVVALFFPETMNTFIQHFGLTDFAPWQIGALLGFVGGFFKSSSTNTSS